MKNLFKKQSKIINKKNSSKKKNLFKYFLALALSNKVTIVFLVINLIIEIIVPFISYNKSEGFLYSFYSKSLLIFAIPIFSNIILIFVVNVMLFSKTKNNNVDLFLYSSSFNKITIVAYKQLAIFTLSTSSFLAIGVNFIINIVMGLGIKISFIILLAKLLSIIFINLIFVVIFAFIASYLSYLGSILVSSMVGLFLVAGSIIPILVQQEKKINANYDALNNKNNIVKIYSWEPNSEKVSISYALYENVLGKTKNKIQGYQTNSRLGNRKLAFKLGL